MSKSPEPKAAFDVRSAAPVLSYVGPGIVSGVPAADLSANALARLASISVGKRGDITGIDDEAIATLRDELLATGNYALSGAGDPE